MRIKANNARGYFDLVAGGVFDATYPNSKTRRGRVQDNGLVCPTLTTDGEVLRMETRYRIRRLTESECLRLMGVSEEDIIKITSAVSPTQAYKQAGNSIVVDVMVAIFDNLFNEKDEPNTQLSIFDLQGGNT